MDLLQDVFEQAGLRSRFLGYRKIADSVTLRFPCEKSIGFHVVTQGMAYMHLGQNSKPIELSAGDIAFTARGRDHLISTDKIPNSKIVSLGDFDARARSKRSLKLTLVSGAYQVWNQPLHPFFDELPEVFLLKANSMQSFDQLHSMIGMLAKEAQSNSLGSDRIQHNVLDILFALILRKVIEQVSAKPETWSHALLDEQIKKSVELMHSNLQKPWTVEALAKEVGVSRASFAVKFKKAMGDTPMQYLTKIRIQKAMGILSTTIQSIESVASAVGYGDAFGFSKVFKKMTGMPPRDYRNRDHAERNAIGRV